MPSICGHTISNGYRSAYLESMMSRYYKSFTAADAIGFYVTQKEEDWDLTDPRHRRGEFHCNNGLLDAVYSYIRYGRDRCCSESAQRVVRAFISCRLTQEREYGPHGERRPHDEIIRAGGQCPPTFDAITEDVIMRTRWPRHSTI